MVDHIEGVDLCTQWWPYVFISPKLFFFSAFIRKMLYLRTPECCR